MSGHALPVVYEVNLSVEAAVAADFRRWLADHVRQMLAIPGFIDACVLEVIDPPPQAGRSALCVQYRVHSMAALQDYFEHRAEAMRAEGLARFGTRFTATRRVLQALAGPGLERS